MLGMAGLGFKPNENQKKYGNFNRRMFAATLDFAIIGILLAPIMNTLYQAYYGAAPIDMHALQAQLDAVTTDSEKGRVFREYMISSGALERWLDNAAMQFSALFILVGVCWHFWAATPGKMIAHLRIVDAETEKPISDIQIFLRLFGYILSALFLLIGFFWIGIDRKKQGWHDKFAGTVVVTVPWKLPKPGRKAADQ